MSGTGGFQTQVTSQPAPAFAGDFASQNPYFTYDAGPGGLVAGSAGVTIGRFAWVYPPLDADNAPQTVLNSGWGVPTGFVHREQQGLITTYLASSGNVIPKGFQMTLMNGGDFWVVNDGSTQATIGQKVYVDLNSGKCSFGATGTPPSSASDSGGAVVNTTLTLVGSVSNNILTVTSVSAGTVYPGAVLSSNAVGTVQPYGTGGTTGTGTTGTYALSVGEQSVAAGTTIGGNYGVYTVGTATGTFAVGMALTGGTTLPTAPPPVLTVLISGTGGNGSTFATSGGAVAQTSHALVGSSAVESKWYAMSSGNATELVKISDHPTG